jgi:preprotein translocase subunit SecE
MMMGCKMVALFVAGTFIFFILLDVIIQKLKHKL